MKGHTRTIAMLVLTGALMFTGCEKRYTESELVQTGDVTESESDTIEESVAETNPAMVMESVEGEKVTEAKPEQMKTFQSSLGYEIVFDTTVFENTRSGDYDEIDLKGQKLTTKTPVLFAAMRIDDSQVEDIVAEIFDATATETTIGSGDYTALCQPTVEDQMYHNQYLVRLDNGDALLFEVQWYENDAQEEDYGSYLTEMLNTIVIDALEPETEFAAEESVEESADLETAALESAD